MPLQMGGGVNCEYIPTDLNNLTIGQTARYIPSTLNKPEDGYGVCITFGETVWLWQIAFTSTTANRFHLRSNINKEGWSSWQKFQAVN